MMKLPPPRVTSERRFERRRSPAAHATALRIGLLLAALVCVPGSAWADKLPPVWGYGVKTCSAFAATAEGRDQGAELDQGEYRRYQDWLTGMITGLNLATGRDVLVGADIDAALRRVRAYCAGKPDDDFFAATMDLVRMLSGLR